MFISSFIILSYDPNSRINPVKMDSITTLKSKSKTTDLISTQNMQAYVDKPNGGLDDPQRNL